MHTHFLKLGLGVFMVGEEGGGGRLDLRPRAVSKWISGESLGSLFFRIYVSPPSLNARIETRFNPTARHKSALSIRRNGAICLGQLGVAGARNPFFFE